MWPWSPETQVTFSLHGLFPHSRLSPLPASRADYMLKLLSIWHPIWSVHRPREENQHRRKEVASSRSPSKGESHLPPQFTLNLNVPAVAHVPLVQNPRGLSPQSRRAQEVTSSQGIPMGLSRSPGQTLSPLPASWLPSMGHPMLSGPPLTLAVTAHYGPLCPELGPRPSLPFPRGNCPARLCWGSGESSRGSPTGHQRVGVRLPDGSTFSGHWPT